MNRVLLRLAFSYIKIVSNTRLLKDSTVVADVVMSRFCYRNTHGNPSSLSRAQHSHSPSLSLTYPLPPLSVYLCRAVVFFFALWNNISGINAACCGLIANNNLPAASSLKFSRSDHGVRLRGRFKLTSKFANSVRVSSAINRPRSGVSPACVIADVHRKVGQQSVRLTQTR